MIEKGQAVYKELCFACHGEDGRGEAKWTAAQSRWRPSSHSCCVRRACSVIATT